MRERSELILADLIQIRAEQEPDLDVLTFEHLSLDGGKTPDEIRSYAELQNHANRIAADLVRRGLQRGDRFALMTRNHPEYVETMIAAAISATGFVPIDPRTRGEKLAYMLRNSGCRGVVCADYCLAQVAAVREQTPEIEWILGLETGEGESAIPLESVSGVDSLREVLSKPAETVDVRLESGNDLLQIIYTSGTTGDPKGVVCPHSRFATFLMLGAIFGYQPDDRPYTGLSFTHGNAQGVTLGPSLFARLRGVFSRRFTKSKIWDVCRAHGCTTFSLLGGMSTAIYSEPLRPDDADNPVRFVVSAGMPLAVWEEFEKRFGLKVFEWYGAVEGGAAFKPAGQGPIGSFGKPAPGLDMQILDDDDVECPPGVVGEICSRPAGGGEAQVEYHGNREASEKKTRGGWLRSGDMGHSDEEGWLYFDYRKGGGIRHNGDFVNAAFVEKVIAEHAAVSDVFVYGIPAASGAPGEKDVVAAIVPVDRESFSAPSIFARCREGLESNFVPSYLQVLDEIPKTASEKPQERFLLAEFAPERPNVFAEERG